MAIDFSKWNKEFGGKKAIEDIKKAQENSGDYPDLPEGKYVCKLEKLELGESRTHKPMVKGMFRIVEGKRKNSCIFYSGVMVANDPSKNGFMMHNVLRFLRSLNVYDDSEIDFDGNFKTFADLLLDIAEDSEGMKFEVETKKDTSGFDRITVTNVFE